MCHVDGIQYIQLLIKVARNSPSQTVAEVPGKILNMLDIAQELYLRKDDIQTMGRGACMGKLKPQRLRTTAGQRAAHTDKIFTLMMLTPDPRDTTRAG